MQPSNFHYKTSEEFPAPIDVTFRSEKQSKKGSQKGVLSLKKGDSDYRLEAHVFDKQSPPDSSLLKKHKWISIGELDQTNGQTDIVYVKVEDLANVLGILPERLKLYAHPDLVRPELVKALLRGVLFNMKDVELIKFFQKNEIKQLETADMQRALREIQEIRRNAVTDLLYDLHDPKLQIKLFHLSRDSFIEAKETHDKTSTRQQLLHYKAHEEMDRLVNILQGVLDWPDSPEKTMTSQVIQDKIAKMKIDYQELFERLKII